MKTKILALSLLSAGLMSASVAMAASTTHSVAVSATVTGNCRFQAVSGATLAFGTIDPSGVGAVTTSGTAAYRCTTGVSPTVTSDDGANETGPAAPRMRIGVTANYLPYTFTIGALVAGTGHGAGQDKTLTINGSIAQVDYANAAAGNYVDTLVLTIAP